MKRLIDQYLPQYDFGETHGIHIKAACDRVYPETLHMNMNDSWITKTLFKLRGLPAADICLKQMVSDGPFRILAQKENTEILIGLLTNHRLVPTRAFNWEMNGNDSPGNGIKIAWNFFLEEENGTRLTTQTRVKCFGRSARIFFTLYWWVIKPFSGLIRIEMLKTIKQQAEKN